jgi:hypothetical protein
VRASDGTIQGTFAVGSDPIAAAFDGSNIWVVNLAGNTVTKLRATDGANLQASCKSLKRLVAAVGLEPTTYGL